MKVKKNDLVLKAEPNNVNMFENDLLVNKLVLLEDLGLPSPPLQTNVSKGVKDINPDHMET